MNVNFFLSTINRLKRLVKIVAGLTVLVIGILMIVLPGPAVVVIPIGLMILATEFVWARTLMERFQERLKKMRNSGGDRQ